MKRYLLDTHILLWMVFEDTKLPRKINTLLTNSDNKLIVSTASIWEIAIKESIKKHALPVENLKNTLKDYNVGMLNISIEHAFHVKELPLIHKDPFDRMLIAQAITENLVLVTVDEHIRSYPKITCF